MNYFNQTKIYECDIKRKQFQSLFQNWEGYGKEVWTFFVSSRSQNKINIVLQSNRPGLMPKIFIKNNRDKKALIVNVRINTSVYLLFVIIPFMGGGYLILEEFPNNNIYLGLLIYSFLGIALNCWIAYSSFSDLNKIIETKLKNGGYK